MDDTTGLPVLRRPHWPYWTSREEWQVIEGALLVAGVEPRSPEGAKIRSAVELPDIDKSPDPVRDVSQHAGYSTLDFPAFLRTLTVFTNALAAIGRGSLRHRVSMVQPFEFLTWAQSREYQLPESLIEYQRRYLEVRVNRWKSRPLWTLLETAHLFAGTEPPSKPDPELVLGAVADWYRDLKDVLTIPEIRSFGNRSPGIGNTLVLPSEVVAWAQDDGRELAPWLSAIADKQPSRADLLAQIAELQKVNAKTASGENQDSMEELEPGERTTLLKLGSYLARKYDYDPGKNNGATGRLLGDMDREGIKLSEKTIRKHMSNGLSRYPRESER